MAGIKKSRGRNNPKMKTKRGAAKRFTKTGTGLVKFGQKGRRHGMSNKRRKILRQKRLAQYMAPGDARLVARQLPFL